MRLMIFAFFFGILIFHTQIITLNIETQSHWILWVILIYLALLLLRYFYILPLPVKLGLAFLLGFIWITLHASIILAQALPEKLAGKNIILYGKIVSIPNKVNCRYSNPELNDWQFDFLPDKTKDYPNLSKIRLTWCDSFLPNLIPNGQWQFQVKLKKAHRPVNFSLPDYNKLLFQQRISITGKVKAAISYTPQFATLTHIRYQLAQHITTYLNDKPQTAALVIALTLGIKNWHPSIKKQYHIFKRTGTTHLFVISGLHLGAIAFITFWVSHFIWRHTTFILRLPALHFSSIISLIVVINYAFLAGFAVQTQRALIMVIAAMVGLLLSKRITLSHRFSLALLFVLLYDPLIIISLGFWLSFLSVAAILYIFETRHQLIQFYSQQVRYLSPDAVNSYLTFHYSQK